MSKAMKFMIGILLVAVLAISFGAGYNVRGQISPGAGEGLELVEQAWDIIFSDYVDRDQLDTAELSHAAIKGMVEAVDDPYTTYLGSESYQLGLSSLEGEFEGIGAQIAVEDEQITIIAPIAGSPAERAGVRAGDIILEVDGKPTAGMSLIEAVLSIRGKKGTSVSLLILHQGESEPEEIEIVRDTIELTSVRSEMRGDIACINITYFSGRTEEEFLPVLESIIEKEAKGIILDLRSNPGGLLDVVVDVASHFLDEGVVVSVEDSEGRRIALEVRSKGITTGLPVVVLVDDYSASGSEVLAGALQDHGRAIIAGTKTYGKGSVNMLRELKDGSGLYITTARWLTPDGHLIEGEGVEPDYELELEGDEAVRWAIDYLKSHK